MEIADEPNAAMLMTQLQPNNTLLDIREQQNTSTSTTPADEDDSGSQPTSLNNHEESFAGCQEESSALQGAEPSSVTYRDTTTGGSSLGDDYVVSGQAGSFLGQSSGSDGPATKSNFRGVSFDKKKRKWRVQIKVANLGKSGVSVGYYDTEEEAARAYDRAAIGLYSNPMKLNFPEEMYHDQSIPDMHDLPRELVKEVLKQDRARVQQQQRRMLHLKPRTSKFFGVGATNRKNQWQARIIVDQKVTHLGYYSSQEEAARVYDKVALALHGDMAQTNYPVHLYDMKEIAELEKMKVNREVLQKRLGVKPMDKSSKYRGVSRKKNKWEAKVMVNRQWKYRELFPTEAEAARAYDLAVRQLKGPEAEAYVNFKEDSDDQTGLSKIVLHSKKLRAIGVVFPDAHDTPCSINNGGPAPHSFTKRVRVDEQQPDGYNHHSSKMQSVPTLAHSRSFGHSHNALEQLDDTTADIDIAPLSIHASHSFVGSGPSMRSSLTEVGAFGSTVLSAQLQRHGSGVYVQHDQQGSNVANEGGNGGAPIAFHPHANRETHNPFAATVYETGSSQGMEAREARGYPAQVEAYGGMHNGSGMPPQHLVSGPYAGFDGHYHPMEEYHPMPPRFVSREELACQLGPAHSEPLWGPPPHRRQGGYPERWGYGGDGGYWMGGGRGGYPGPAFSGGMEGYHGMSRWHPRAMQERHNSMPRPQYDHPPVSGSPTMRTYSCTLSNGVANAAQQHATQNNNNENNNNNSNPQKLASRASAPEPATHQRPTLVRQWSEASGQMIALGGGKGVSRCFSELLPRPPSTRMLTQMLDAMTQDMDDPIMAMLGNVTEDMPTELLTHSDSAPDATTPLLVNTMVGASQDPCPQAACAALPPLPASTAMPLSGDAVASNVLPSDMVLAAPNPAAVGMKQPEADFLINLP